MKVRSNTLVLGAAVAPDAITGLAVLGAAVLGPPSLDSHGPCGRASSFPAIRSAFSVRSPDRVQPDMARSLARRLQGEKGPPPQVRSSPAPKGRKLTC